MRRKEQTFDLERFRREKKLSQKDIAESVNLPQSFLSAIEHGKKVAPESLIDDLARIYKIDNISNYMMERKDPSEEKYQNIKASMIDSKGLNINLNGIDSDTASALINVLGKYVTKDEENATVERNQPPGANPSTVAILADLLAKSEERNAEAQKRIKELEKEVEGLKSRLPKRDK